MRIDVGGFLPGYIVRTTKLFKLIKTIANVKVENIEY